ncbi:MAG: FG-GAP repeat protein, partial [Ignavibacteria bacterium]|nr:FG-GAP repeat protein [Ignavibacteria bacterium]
QRKIFNGLSAGSQFGVSVSSAGDVNGDGFDDIIIGAYLYNSNTGRAYIYYGGLNLNTTADVILTGEAASNVFGCSVSSAGDVNGDGYSDVIVGAYGYSSNKGRAYIYFGGASMNNTADVTFTGELPGNDFGTSVSAAGDVNGDGYSDVIVSADLYSSNTGKAYIYFGGASMNNSADVTMTGNATSDTFGKSVSAAGDVNGDGFSDVIIGATGYSSNTGRAYIFMGAASMDNNADVLLTGEASGNNFGVSVSSAGDVNGDGYSDVICGAYGFNSNTGKAYVYYGGAIMNSTADVSMTGESVFNFFGNSVSTAGDVNGDGFSDVIISEFGYNSFSGKAFIFFGGTSMNNIPDITMNEEIINSYFGISAASAGDVNADGFSDIIIGAYGYGANTGRAYFYDYFMKNEIIPDLTMTGESSSNYFGTSVSDAGDVNGDGFGDVIAGAYGNNSITGKAYIYYGGSNMDNAADVELTGEAAGNAFGISVSSAGDVNGDGYSDVIAGAPGYNSNRGRAYIYFGGSSMNNIADVIMTGLNTNDEIGREVSNSGDLNGDGFSDVAVSAPFINKVYIYYGSASMNNAADITINMSVSSIAPAGDVNGDGFSDLITGVNISGNGNAYIYYGGENADNISDVTFSGEANGDAFGSSVSAGDINADGFSDVIVGAFGCNSYTGKAYIFTGSEQPDVVPDVTMTGETANNLFGASVSAGGDINGDGFSDVIVGGEGYNSNSGKCYIFFGGRILNNSPDVTMKGEPASNFGDGVSIAGDLNGDGYSDIITGAKNYNSNTGKSYIYTGSAVSVKPNILSVKDLPGDQGGYVNIKFARSAFDIPFSETGGVNYQIERSAPPNISGYHWTSVATVLGTHNTVYSAEVHTPLDSGNLSNNTYYFRVTAVSNTTSNIWRSNILSGYSLDNIAP